MDHKQEKIWRALLSLVAMIGSGSNALAEPVLLSYQTTDTPRLGKNSGIGVFIDAGSAEAADYLVAAHRSHRSHSSHRSHYSSRGGGYTAPSYTPPRTTPTAPVQQRQGGTSESRRATSQYSKTLVQKIQRGLLKLDYTPGVADGVLRDETRQAIRLFQTDQGLSVTGIPTETLLEAIKEAIVGQ